MIWCEYGAWHQGASSQEQVSFWCFQPYDTTTRIQARNETRAAHRY